jgi:hypothetical protein
MTTKFGQRAQISQVEAAGMGGAVGADQPGAIHRESTGRFWIATSWTTWS